MKHTLLFIAKIATALIAAYSTAMLALPLFDNSALFVPLFLFALAGCILCSLFRISSAVLLICFMLLAFIADIQNKEIPIPYLLGALLCGTIILVINIYGMHLKESHSQGSASAFLPFVAGIAILVLVCTGALYQFVLLPNISPDAKFALLQHEKLDSAYQTLQENLSPPDQIDDTQASLNEDSPTEIDHAPQSSGTDFSQNGALHPLIILWIVLIASIVFLAFFFLRKLLRWRKWKKQTIACCQEEQIVRLYQYLLCLLASIGLQKHESETPYEFCQRLDAKAVPLNLEDMQVLTDTFVQAAYSQHTLQSENCKNYYHFFQKLPALLKRKLGIFNYYKICLRIW